ncbi:pre-peptidase C-terminal domain-containing protein [Kamptonema formosum]|uniref:pre-peptidase C-terminal domain-containing protein n=1 Tax=Kamptonema formosum TaxID=331992 RepID=UPI00034D53C4|nr:pre-peptidase C-terminal domain-containing protein [Oscillatoria sp. PCC 10802]
MAVNVFDANFYRSANADLRNLNDAQALQHLLNFGLNERRTFSPLVDLSVYAASNPDLAAAGLTTNRQLYDHLSNFGVKEGRGLSTVFNVSFYRNANPDLAAAGLTNEQLFDHFRNFGIKEGRASSPTFNVSFYLNNNADLKQAGFNYQQALEHYVNFGRKEGRIASSSGAAPTPTPTVGDPLPPANSTLRSATDLGVLSANRTITDFVGTDDRNDYYRFTLNNNSDVDLTLGALTDYAKVQLIKDYNQNGEINTADEEVLQEDSGSSSSNADISTSLQAGTYFMRVFPYSTDDNTNYDLRLGVTSKPATTSTDPGSTLSTALNIGALSANTTTFKDFVGLTDPNDYYGFTLNSNSNLSVTLAALTDYANVQLIKDKNNNGQIDNGDGDVLKEDYGYSGSNADISTDLERGSYFIRVSRYYTDDNTNYELRLAAEAVATSQNRPNLLNSTLNIDPLTGTPTSDQVAGSSEAVSKDTTVSVIQEFNGNGSATTGTLFSDAFGSSSSDTSNIETLASGTDFAGILASNPLDSTNYSTNLTFV